MKILDFKHYRYDRGYPFLMDEPGKYIELIEFDTLRETKGGYWIRRSLSKYAKEIFVSKSSKKRYAYPTKKEAFNSFILRTVKAYGYSVSNINNAIDFINILNKHELLESPIIMKKLNINTLDNV